MIRVEAADLAGLTRDQTAALVRHRTAAAANVEDWKPRRRLPTIEGLERMLPAGLGRGTVVGYTGVLSPLLGMIARASTVGWVALINVPGRADVTASLLAVDELGGNTNQIAVINYAVDERLVTATHTCLDGMAMVVAEIPDRLLPPAKAKILLARAHSQESTLVLLDPAGRMKGMDLYLGASCIGIDGLGCGSGRITAQTYQLDVTPRRGNSVTGVIRKEPRPGGQMGWSWVEPSARVIDLPARAG